jgi:hypothetical protein
MYFMHRSSSLLHQHSVGSLLTGGLDIRCLQLLMSWHMMTR